ncbi:hypothetical protein [Profundibacter sp.]
MENQKTSDLPEIQAVRFDIETLQYNAASLAKYASQAPLYIRHNGVIAFAILPARMFDEIWVGPQRRVYSTDELPDYLYEELIQGIEQILDD